MTVANDLQIRKEEPMPSRIPSRIFTLTRFRGPQTQLSGPLMVSSPVPRTRRIPGMLLLNNGTSRKLQPGFNFPYGLEACPQTLQVPSPGLVEPLTGPQATLILLAMGTTTHNSSPSICHATTPKLLQELTLEYHTRTTTSLEPTTLSKMVTSRQC